MQITKELKKAIIIGFVCISSYLASYYMRNILSVCTPEMLKTGLFTKELVGSFSSVYFFAYAIGQLINGIIGDRIRAKNMVMAGLNLCGVASVIFPFCNVIEVRLVLFFLMGFALSMLRGPLIKTISENTRPDYAKVCCVFFSFASFAGPLIASLFAMVFNWKYTFVVSGISCVCIALVAYAVLSNLEKRKVINPMDIKQSSRKPKSVLSVFKLDNYIFYLFVSAIVEISAISINFWLPTYFCEHLGFQKDVANGIFSLITFICSFIPFIALIVLKIFKDNDIKWSDSFLHFQQYLWGVHYCLKTYT